MPHHPLHQELPDYLTDASWPDPTVLHKALQRLEAQRFLLAVAEWYLARPEWRGEFRVESMPAPETERYSLGPEVFDEDLNALVPHMLTRQEVADINELLMAFERAARHGHTSLSAEVAEALNACSGRPRAVERMLRDANRKNGDTGFDPEVLFAQARAARLGEHLPEGRGSDVGLSKRRM